MPSSPMPSAIGSSTRHSRSTLPARAIGVSKPENLLPGKKTRNDCDLRLRRCPTQGGTELRKSPGPQTGNCAFLAAHVENVVRKPCTTTSGRRVRNSSRIAVWPNSRCDHEQRKHHHANPERNGRLE